MTKLGSLLQVKGYIRKYRQDKLPLMLKTMEAGSGELRVAIDCSLDNFRSTHMSDKEISHLAKQVTIAHSLNYQSPRPCHLHLTGLEVNGRIDIAFRKQIAIYDKMMLTRTEQSHHVYFNPEDIVYLSPDSNVELQSVDPATVYVIGGLVDRTVDKFVTERLAKSLGLKTAKLPILKYVRASGGQHLYLPVNLVLGILLSVHADGDWTKAFNTFIPQRKRLTDSVAT